MQYSAKQIELLAKKTLKATGGDAEAARQKIEAMKGFREKGKVIALLPVSQKMRA